MQPQSSTRVQVAVLSDSGMAWAGRLVWVVCIGVYLTVFIGGIRAGGGDLMTVGRAVGFSLAAAVLGRIAVNLLGQASLPVDPGPMDDEDGQLGSLPELVSSANVPQSQDESNAAVTGER